MQSSKNSINTSALFHEVKSAYSWLDEDMGLNLILRTAHAEFDRVGVVSMPAMAGPDFKTEPLAMQAHIRDKNYDYYSVRLSGFKDARLAYGFELWQGNKQYYYTELGLIDTIDWTDWSSIRHARLFVFPYFNKKDIHRIPNWSHNAICYQIFPDRFANGDTSNDPAGTAPWGTAPSPWNRMGGDLQGILDKLDYLHNLGVNLLYLTPIFKAHSNHKYDTIDYKCIDPEFGSNELLGKLVQACHARGMKLVLDAVFNHCGPDFFAFKDVLEKQEQSTYRNWFYIKRFPIENTQVYLDLLKHDYRKTIGQQGENILPYETFAYTPMMPKLNTENEGMRNYLLEVAQYWIKEWGIDGWRLDVANEVDHEFWRDFRKAVKNANPEAIIVGEIWSISTPWLRGDQFDAVMDYVFQENTLQFFINKKIDASTMIAQLNDARIRYTGVVTKNLWSMLDSHDTMRIITAANGDHEQALLTYAFQLTYTGVPFIYYGTETALEGNNDPDCRRCMPWDGEWEQNTHKKNFAEAIRKLIKVRREQRVLREGGLHWLETGHEDLLGFERFDDNSKLTIFLNRGKTALCLAQNYQHCFDLVSETQCATEIAGQGILILKKM